MLIETLIALTSMSIFLVIYHHLGYPIILRIAKKFKGQPSLPLCNAPHYRMQNAKSSFVKATYPQVTVIMAAYNEGEYIQEKIRNLACQDYPSDSFKVILGCDGCTDNTAALAREVLQEDICKHLQLEVFDFSVNRGKVSVLNALIPKAEESIVALTDVSSLVSIDALSVVAARFKDPKVGAVNGNYRLLNPGRAGEAVYWRYQSQIKIGEEALGSVLGAHGAFYAIRKELFKTLEKNTINDDFILPMRTIEKGYRVVYEARLNALELEKADPSLNWRRRLRICSGNIQQLVQLRELLHPKYRGIALAFISGKGLRVAMPFIMLFSLFGSWGLSFYIPIFAFLTCAQSVLYAIALWVQIAKPKNAGKVAMSIHYLVSGHVAGFISCIRYFTGATARW